jgi:membrane protein
MSEHSPLSPEARAVLPVVEEADVSEASWFEHLGKFHQSWEVVKRMSVGVYSEGFVHAGNFAYLSLVVLFSFCIVAAAIAGAFGQTQSGLALINAFFKQCRPALQRRCGGRSKAL